MLPDSITILYQSWVKQKHRSLFQRKLEGSVLPQIEIFEIVGI